jgi:tetratricopeptide (TPR) repeat protein
MTLTKFKKHILYMSMIAILLLLFLFPVRGICETKEIIAEGEYVMGAGETMAIAEERALKKAAQNAAEEAGAFVKSYSKVQNMTLAEDVVEVVANHAMKITVLDRKKSVIGNLDAIKFQVKIKAVLTTEEVAANLKKVREDKGVIESYNRLKTDYDRQAREMETLKKRLTESGGEEKKQVLAQITNEEKRFKANLWLEKAAEFGIYGESALKAYDKAIELNPTLVEAYVGKARIISSNSSKECSMLLEKGPSDCALQQENLAQALTGLNKVISLDKGHAEAYAVRAEVYRAMEDVRLRVAISRKESDDAQNEIKKKDAAQIFDNINFAISLKPDNPEYYKQRSNYFDLPKEADKAIDDMTRAVVLCREVGCSNLSHYLSLRGAIYASLGKNDLSNKDYDESIKIMEGILEESKGIDLRMQNSEIMKLRKELYAGITDPSLMQDKKKIEQTLKELNRKISQKKGKAEDYILRADLSDDKENNLRDYSEAIRLLKSGRPEGKNALLLMRVYFDKALAYEKQHDSVLKELKEARNEIDKQIPRALNILKFEDYMAITRGAEGTQDKVMKMNRSEAEAFYWLYYAKEVINKRAAIYEEMALPVKAKAEYQYLCEKLKDAEACKNLERLK